jgi:microcystin-dependent protein
MTDQYLGEIRIVPFNFAPTGWAMCEGQLLPISQNTALFSLLGTFYGGNGTSNFQLPNMQGNIPVDQGQGPGLTDRVLGEVGGVTNVTLLTTEMPAHAHFLNGDTTAASSTSPANNLNAQLPGGRFPDKGYVTTAPNASMLAGNLLPTGGNQPHNNMMPYLALNFIIAMVGIFPTRS